MKNILKLFGGLFVSILILSVSANAGDYMRDYDQERLKVKVSVAHVSMQAGEEINFVPVAGVALGFTGYALDGELVYEYLIEAVGTKASSDSEDQAFLKFGPKIKVGYIPFESYDFSASAVISYNWMKTDINKVSKSLDGFGYGVQFLFPITDLMNLELEYERSSLSGSNTKDIDTNIVYFGISYTF
jgi:opacity protein-like surface antigen